jgi:predicted DNA-binding transcriptional regulator AlpA
MLSGIEQGLASLVRLQEIIVTSPLAGDTLLTETEVADKTGISVVTLRTWRSGKKGIPYVKLGGSVRYRVSAVRDFIHRNSIKVTDETGRVIG